MLYRAISLNPPKENIVKFLISFQQYNKFDQEVAYNKLILLNVKYLFLIFSYFNHFSYVLMNSLIINFQFVILNFLILSLTISS